MSSVECIIPAAGGVLVIDKPAGITSHDVVDRLRRVLGTKRIGHAGTLDPMATGVLALCIDSATRVMETLSASTKEYVAGVRFGLTTDTLDTTGLTTGEADASGLTAEQVEARLPAFRGLVLQVPPMVSARHHQGRRLYDLAREGVEVEREARPITISRLELTSFEPGPVPEAVLEIECSAGTYIRTLASDLGAAVGVGAAMSALRRTRSGSFTLADALPLEAVERTEALANAARARLHAAMGSHTQVMVILDDALAFLHGQAVGECSADEGAILSVWHGEALLGLGKAVGGRVQPWKVLASIGQGEAA